MAVLRISHPSIFCPIIRRLFGANPGRLFVMLLALGAGAAVTAALLNLQVDAKRRLTAEFRSFGANVVIAPRNFAETLGATISEALLDRLPPQGNGQPIPRAAFLYATAEMTAYSDDGKHA